MTTEDRDDLDSLYTRPHLKFGWWSLLLFLTLGIVLETLHGFKIGWYLDVSNTTRRMMLTLAHTHGTLLAIVHIAFAFTVRATRIAPGRAASHCLRGASLLLPGGFFLGGLVINGGDPGVGILLVPVGGLLLLIAVALTARNLSRG